MPVKMLAAVFHENGGPEVVSVEEVDRPEPAPGEARIRVEAASLNHLDLWVRRGLPIEIPMPHIGGSDFAGTVDTVGSDGDRGWVGRRVVVDPSLGYDWYELATMAGADPLRIVGEHTQGGFAEFAVAPVANLVELPEGFPASLAAAGALVGVTAWHGLFAQGGLRAGERVLVTGASGGVGTVAVQIAGLAGAEVYALTSRTAEVGALGADHTFDRREPAWPRELYRATGRRGVDICLDSVGEAIWPDVLRTLAVGGRLVCYGATTGHHGHIDIRRLFWRKQSIVGSTMGTPADFRAVMALVFDGRIAPPIHAELPLAEARAAHRLLEAGEVFGKVVLIPHPHTDGEAGT